MRISGKLALAAIAMCVPGGAASAQFSKGQIPENSAIAPESYELRYDLRAKAAEDPSGDAVTIQQDPAELTFDQSFSDTVMAEFPSTGEDASAALSFDTGFTLNTDTGVLTGSFVADGSTMHTREDDGETVIPQTGSGVRIQAFFEVTTGTANIAITGSGAVAISGSGPASQVGITVRQLFDGFSPVIFVRNSARDAPGGFTVDESSELPAGRYSLEVEIVNSSSDKKALQSFSSSASLNIEITVAPGDAEEFFWSVNDGAFGDENNWEPLGVPGSGDTAIFDRDAQYAVTMVNEFSQRSIVERGFVTFSGGSYEVGSESPQAVGAVVGNTSGDMATLNLSNHNFTTLLSAIGLGAGTTGEVVVDEALWQELASKDIGVAGNGAMTLLPGATVFSGTTRLGVESTGFGAVDLFGAVPGKGAATGPEWNLDDLTVGVQGNGTVTVHGGFVDSNMTVLGSAAGSGGTVIVGGTEKGPQAGGATWIARGRVLVGVEGTGNLTIQNGGVFVVVEDAGEGGSILVAPGSMGTVAVTGADTMLSAVAELEVGRFGSAELTVNDGGEVTAETVEIGLGFDFLGTGAPAEANLDAGNLTAQISLVVGGSGTGTLTAINNSTVTSLDGGIGSRNNGDGHVILENSVWNLQFDLFIGIVDENGTPIGTGELTLANNGFVTAQSLTLATGSTIHGAGNLVVPNCEFNGTVDPGTPEKGSKEKGGGPKSLKQGGTFGTLIVDGDAVFDGANIVIDTAGADPAVTDAIMVTGAADIVDATIQFNFFDDFLAQTGDTVPFFIAQGGLTVQNVALEFDGAADGFQFDIKQENGMLIFEALNDAQPLPSETVGCSAGGGGTGSSTDLLVLLGVAVVFGQIGKARTRRSYKC